MLTVPSGSDAVVIDRGVAMAIVKDFVPLCGVAALSVTFTTKLNVPAAVGVPLMIPSGDSPSPVGRGPGASVQM